MLKYSIGLLFFVCFLATSFGQPLREPTYEMKIIKAEELNADGDYYNALEMYKECYSESKDYFLISTIAKLNVKLRDYERAEKWYERMVERPDRYYTKLVDTFYYAQVLKTNRKYPEAFNLFQQYIALSEDDSLVAVAENELIGMDLASRMKERKDLFVEPLPENVNTGLTEASPVMGADGYMYYSTFKKRSKIVIDKDADDFHFKIYKSKEGEDDKWEKPDKLTKKINREDYHTGNVSFSKDGNTMYFTRSRLYGDSILSSEIYYSNFDGDKWEGARKLAGINGDWIATHPAPGAHFGDEVLYFVSNQPGGYGGYDIYYSTHQGGNEYSSPVNLGDAINTNGDEVTPYYVDGTLYFSTNARPGLGGLDVFMTKWDGSNFSEPVNMALPHNSTYDDFYFSWNPEEKKGFLVSNRPYPKKRSSKSETCCDDIFAVAEQDIELNALVTSYDENKKPITGAKVILKEFNRGDLNVVDTKNSAKGNTFDFPLKVDKQYRVIIQHPDFVSDSFDIKTVGLIDAKTFEKKFYLKPKPKLPPKEEVTVYTINEPIRLNRIYYDLDDDQILPEAEPDLRTLQGLMSQYPTMVIELSSHTDSRGRDAYNQDLSLRRAESAKQWLVDQGVNPGRIETRGYGETQLLNDCGNGASCTEEEHRFNRRTEFKIIAGPTSIEVKKERIDTGSGSRRTGAIDVPAPTRQIETVTTTSSSTMASLEDVPVFDAPIMESTDFESVPLNKKAEIKLKGKFKDFGIVYPGEKKSHIIKFQNVGDAALVIERVTGEACLDIVWPDYPILPGQNSEITLTYDSSNRKGEDELTLNIITNTDQRVHSARVRAFVQ